MVAVPVEFTSATAFPHTNIDYSAQFSYSLEAAKIKENFFLPGKSLKYVPKNILKITFFSEPLIPSLTVHKHYGG